MKTTDICDLEYTKIIPEKNKNILCASFFIMRESYKDISIYLKGLNEIINYLNEYNNNANSKHKPIYFRLYHDQSLDLSEDSRVIELMVLLRSNPYTELVLYKPHQYVADVEYAGLFGTVMRYIPCFSFEDNNDVGYYYITDIDVSEYHENEEKQIVKILEYIIENEAGFYYQQNVSYEPYWSKNTPLNKYVIVGGAFGGKVKLNPEILKNFLKEIVKENTDDILIQNFRNIYLKHILGLTTLEFASKKTISFKQNQYLIYGFDEFFLLYYVFPEILKIPGLKIIHRILNNYLIYGLIKSCFDNIIEKIKNNNQNIGSERIHFFEHLFRELEPEIKHIEKLYFTKNNARVNNSRANNAQVNEYIVNMYNRLIKIFIEPDYDDVKPEIHDLYHHFHKLIQQQFKHNKNLLMLNKRSYNILIFLLRNNQYYHKNNSYTVFSETTKRNMYEEMMNEQHKIFMKYKNNKNKNRKTTKQRRTTVAKRRTTRKTKANKGQ